MQNSFIFELLCYALGYNEGFLIFQKMDFYFFN